MLKAKGKNHVRILSLPDESKLYVRCDLCDYTSPRLVVYQNAEDLHYAHLVLSRNHSKSRKASTALAHWPTTAELLQEYREQEVEGETV